MNHRSPAESITIRAMIKYRRLAAPCTSPFRYVEPIVPSDGHHRQVVNLRPRKPLLGEPEHTRVLNGMLCAPVLFSDSALVGFPAQPFQQIMKS